MWRSRFGRRFGPVVRQTTTWMMNIWLIFVSVFWFLVWFSL
jgi:hypothetical protein